MAIDKKLLGQNVRALRKREELNGEKFSSSVGITKSALSQIENGTVAPSLDLLQEIVLHYGGLMDDLLIDSSKPRKPAHFDSRRISMVPIKAHAGYVRKDRKPEYVTSLPDIMLPNIGAGDFRAFEIEGYSMLTDIGSGFYPGDIVVARACILFSSIRDHQICILVLRQDTIPKIFLTRCYFRTDLDGLSSIRCEADNKDPQYPSFTVAMENVSEVWIFERKITAIAPNVDAFWRSFGELQERVSQLEKISRRQID